MNHTARNITVNFITLILWGKRFRTEQNIVKVMPLWLYHTSPGLIKKIYLVIQTKHKLSFTACKKSNPHGNYDFGKKLPIIKIILMVAVSVLDEICLL